MTALPVLVAARSLTWTAEHVREDNQDIDPGWYVTGRDPGNDPECGPSIELRVWAVDNDHESPTCGQDRTQQVAEALAELLGATPAAGEAVTQ